MKVKMSFELDLENTGYNIDNLSELRLSIQNLSSWLHELHEHYLDRRMETWDILNDVERQFMKATIERDIKLSKQLFNNHSIQGITDDGHSFEFNHQEPGYKETMIIDGNITDDY
jgi:hypothetical protein